MTYRLSAPAWRPSFVSSFVFACGLAACASSPVATARWPTCSARASSVSRRTDEPSRPRPGPRCVPAVASPFTAEPSTAFQPRAVELVSSGGALDLDLTLAQGTPAPRWEQLAVRDLRLHRVEDLAESERPLARPVSTIQSGSLYFEALGGTERKLRAGELLRFGAASGTLLTLDLREDGIAATFQGDVREMHSGSGDEPQSLMPTLLEWLRKRQALSLLWGTALYLSGIALTLRRWWRKPE